MKNIRISLSLVALLLTVVASFAFNDPSTAPCIFGEAKYANQCTVDWTGPLCCETEEGFIVIGYYNAN